MTTRVLVSPDALSGLISRLRGVQQALHDDVSLSTAHVGQTDLVDALADFSRNWAKKRSEFVRDLDEVTRCLVNARDQFTEVDRRLARGLTAGQQ